MFEIWQDRGDPEVWLLFRESPSFPSSFAVDEWMELGSCAVHAEIAGLVDKGGYLLIRAPGPFDAAGTIGPDWDPA